MSARTAVPAELLGDSEATLRRAADLLASLAGEEHDGAATDCGAASSLVRFSQDLRRLGEQIDGSAAEIAWCLHEARSVLRDLEKRLARLAADAASGASPD